MKKSKLILSATVFCLAATISTASFAKCPWQDKPFTAKSCGTVVNKKQEICNEKNAIKSITNDLRNQLGRAKCESKDRIKAIKDRVDTPAT